MKKVQISRFEVIDDKGRSYCAYDCEIKQSLQDDGRTLKIFIQKKQKKARLSRCKKPTPTIKKTK